MAGQFVFILTEICVWHGHCKFFSERESKGFKKNPN